MMSPGRSDLSLAKYPSVLDVALHLTPQREHLFSRFHPVLILVGILGRISLKALLPRSERPDLPSPIPSNQNLLTPYVQRIS